MKPGTWVPLTLKSQNPVSDKMSAFDFHLPKATDHTGCFAGQYVKVSDSFLFVRSHEMQRGRERTK